LFWRRYLIARNGIRCHLEARREEECHLEARCEEEARVGKIKKME
jgi:hypothetical protein